MQPIVVDVEAIGIPDCETYLEPAKAPENWKDPVKIAAYLAEARETQIDKAALDVDLAQIICIGVLADDSLRVRTTEKYDEAELLESLWEVWRSSDNPSLVTFGGLNYDVPLLLRRSLYLGVKAPYISCNKYRHPQQIDLMSILSMEGALKWRGLQFYLNRFGYTGGGPDITGAEVAARYKAGDWAAIEQHCRMDVEATAWLAQRIGAVKPLRRLDSSNVSSTLVSDISATSTTF